MLQAYVSHVAERAALGIPPLPLTAQQTADLVELLKNPSAAEADFLLDLITNRVPAALSRSANCSHASMASTTPKWRTGTASPSTSLVARWPHSSGARCATSSSRISG